MSDLISRQDAIDAYVKYTIDCLSPKENLRRPFTVILEELPSAEIESTRSCEYSNGFSEGFNAGYEACKRAIIDKLRRKK